ncbi:MAG: lysylphosphatidylglycerol synthase transmembrane domain-containing protein [Actinomycetota bacterium]|nr:lysylphosphatidylglycerol synthase transmembrane domain-containing protein [Actinomycetota bacterium]
MSEEKSLSKKLKKPLFMLLKLVVSGGLLWFIMHKAGIVKVAGLMEQISIAAFLLAVFLYLFSLFVSSLRWGLLVRSNLGVWKLCWLYLMGSFFNVILPGLVGGDAIKGYYFYKLTGKGAEAAASIFMERYLGFIAMLVISIIAYPFGFPYLRSMAPSVTFFGEKLGLLALVLPAVVAGALIFTALFLVLRIGKGIRYLADFYGYFDMFGKAAIIKGVLLSFGVQLLNIISVYILARSLHITVSPALFLVFVPLIITFSFVPISISGLGIREASFVLLFGAVGVSAQAATALSFAWFLSIVLASLTGIVEYIRIKKA